MNPDPQEWIHGYLDGLLSEEQEDLLNQWIKASPENAQAFAQMVCLHDRLHNSMVTRSLKNFVADESAPVPAESSTSPTSPTSPPRTRRRFRLLGGLAAGAALLLLAVWWGLFPQESAARELDRLIAQAVDVPARSYVIRNRDEEPETFDERRPPIDGAILHVRAPDCYVLIRKFPDGRLFVTGSDGEKSWSVPAQGAVRVSSDPMRFRGPVPGHQQGIPFVNLRSDLMQLREAYHVTPLGVNEQGHRGLLAKKKSVEYRGPNRVELWYDSATGVIHQMMFAGMPKARGGPDRLVVDLLDQQERDNGFFQHTSHHTADRRVIEED